LTENKIAREDFASLAILHWRDPLERGVAGVHDVCALPSCQQMIAAIILATLTYSNRPAAMAAVWITNPFTAVPIYLMTYRVGRSFTPNCRSLDLR
jgi:uncharacterized protein (DUF2062 family)